MDRNDEARQTQLRLHQQAERAERLGVPVTGRFLAAEEQSLARQEAARCGVEVSFDGGWPEAERARWQRLLDACDYETMVQDHYSSGCMMRRNRYMVDHAAMLIAVYDGQSGGTQRTVEYALRRQIPVTLVPPVEE